MKKRIIIALSLLSCFGLWIIAIYFYSNSKNINTYTLSREAKCIKLKEIASRWRVDLKITSTCEVEYSIDWDLEKILTKNMSLTVDITNKEYVTLFNRTQPRDSTVINIEPKNK